ncbi:MAG TPA: hypothetical protein VEP90_30165 [Methylomirabilota bacterium]|nr:hypothetical protein [Methylomirabilota bacterium]
MEYIIVGNSRQPPIAKNNNLFSDEKHYACYVPRQPLLDAPGLVPKTSTFTERRITWPPYTFILKQYEA